MGTLSVLSSKDARAVAVRAQGFGRGSIDIHEVFSSTKCLQLDSIAAVRRSHELVALSRGAAANDVAELLTRSTPLCTFEYQAHAACILPLDLWPAFAMRRRQIQMHGWRGPVVDAGACQEVRARLRCTRSLTITDLGGSKGSGWERSGPLKWAAEWLLWTGEAVSLVRQNWKRVYQLACEALPLELLASEPDDTDCLRLLVSNAMDALGVATSEDVADYFRLAPAAARRVLEELEIPRVAVEGWKESAWLSRSLCDVPMIVEDRAVALSPFDSLVWYRPRLRRIFGRDYLLEAYKPEGRRAFGYFAMPILVGDTIAGRVAPRRRGNTLVIEAVEWDENLNDPQFLMAAIDQLRAWTGTSAVEWPLPGAAA